MIEMHRVGATFTVAHRPNGTDSSGDRKGRPYACIVHLNNNILENTR